MPLAMAVAAARYKTCSKQSLWIIQNNQDLFLQRNVAVEFFKCHF